MSEIVGTYYKVRALMVYTPVLICYTSVYTSAFIIHFIVIIFAVQWAEH